MAVALLPAVHYFAVTGLETLLFACLFTTAVLCLLTDRERRRPLSPATGIACLGLALTRPEGVLVWLLAWGLSWGWSCDVRRQLVAAAWFVVPAGVFELWRLVYFGQLVPNSIVVKAGLPWAVTEVADRVEFLRYWHQYAPILVVGLVVAVGCLAGRVLTRAFRPIVVILVVMLAFDLATSSGDSYPEERYLFVTLPVLVAVSVAALARFGWPDRARRRSHAGPTDRLRRQVIAVVCVLAFVGVSLAVAHDGRERIAVSTGTQGLSPGLPRVAEMLRPDRLADHAGRYQFPLVAELDRTQPAGTVIAMDEIGTVAYYGHLRVLDLYGLGDEHIAHLPGGPGGRADPDYVFDQQPRDIILLSAGCLCAPGARRPRVRHGHPYGRLPPARAPLQQLRARCPALRAHAGHHDRVT